LIEKCADIGDQLKKVMDFWKEGENNTELPKLKPQSSLISSNYTLKGYQLFGISWLLLLYSKKLGGILADEVYFG
jgi:SNF2 family DNA or RNA helicase